MGARIIFARKFERIPKRVELRVKMAKSGQILLIFPCDCIIHGKVNGPKIAENAL